MNEIEILKYENRKLIAKIQEQNSNINLLNNKFQKQKKEVQNYKRLYENEYKERRRLSKLLFEKQEKFNI